ncbi:dienelactone hydrolase family protein [Zobellia alginiliquefaciens]|uniref:dienelactone hydrolase family protein n=1 Tax=Zobellia alginiliquefaciens TaxID=3032586 RepID=UPI0023E4675B|nr:dienelactone hydrolase family protein [Zobellia alginiliquefaciens]
MMMIRTTVPLLKRMLGVWVIMLQIWICPNLTMGQKDPSRLFRPYLIEEGPKIVKDLGEEIEGGVRLRKLVFHSYTYMEAGEQKSAEVFAAIARPAKEGNYPGLLVLHGGAGYAQVERAKKWAAQGYVTVVLDEPGVAAPDKIPMTHGPWEKYEYGENRFVVKPEIKSSTLFSAILASIQGLYLLHSQPDVINDKIGVTGVSWGGYLTTFISGLANSKITASFSVYGSGYYDLGSTFLKILDNMSSEDRAIWLKNLDAGRVAEHIEIPFFIAAAANDNWFYPPAVSQTLKSIKGETNHLYAPNNSHKIELPGGTSGISEEEPGWLSMELVYFEYFLKGKGMPFPNIDKIESVRMKNGNTKIRFQVMGAGSFSGANVCYALENEEWPQKVWEIILATSLNNGWFEAEIPTGQLEDGVVCFASISDSRPVTVSSSIIKINN